MKSRFLTALAFLFVSVTSCYDDTGLRELLADHEQRIQTLETLCRQMNTNITSLQTIVDAIQQNDYIKSVTPVQEGSEVIGYTIEFVKNGSITIYHGKNGQNGADGQDGAPGKDGANGQDGHTPVIGVQQDADGKYYWTLDGEWLLDAAGNKIPTTGENGRVSVSVSSRVASLWKV